VADEILAIKIALEVLDEEPPSQNHLTRGFAFVVGLLPFVGEGAVCFELADGSLQEAMFLRQFILTG